MSSLWKTFTWGAALLLFLTGCLPAEASASTNTTGKDPNLQKVPTQTIMVQEQPTLTIVQATPTPETSTVPATVTPEATIQGTPGPNSLATPGPNSLGTPALVPTGVDPGSLSSGDVILLAAGDIADCNHDGDELTSKILAQYPGVPIAALGDNVYEDGTAEEFAQCYDPTWGQFKDRTYPAVGNHEYGSPDAAPYYEYFGAAAGDPDKGYYSYDLGAWHIIVINSNCNKVGGCKVNNPQYQWLAQDLRANPTDCSLAYWHHPRYSSGQWGNYEQMEPIWELLYRYGVELVVSGHDHDYERFKPIGPNELVEEQFGIRQFVVGTGGKQLGEIISNRPLPASEITDVTSYGVLKLTLKPDRYLWEFLPAEGSTFTDSGEAACHPAPG